MCQHHSETMAPAPLLINGFQVYYSWHLRERASEPFRFLHKMQICWGINSGDEEKERIGKLAPSFLASTSVPLLGWELKHEFLKV